ncbi:MAG: hypothetical protein K6G01_03285 [Eubacterium sp.]|nr:hypothetical protein [Eubacterium sp.]
MMMKKLAMERFNNYVNAAAQERKRMEFEESLREIKSSLTVSKCYKEPDRIYHIPAVEY